MAADLAHPAPSPYKDRRGWLIAFGVIEIVIAFICLLLTVVLALTFPQLGQANPSQQNQGLQAGGLVAVILVYGVAGVAFLAVGIGSIRCRNWARIAMLVVSGFWLGTGVLSTLVMALLFPAIMRQQGRSSAEARQVGFVVVMLFMGFFMMVLPGIFLYFYSRQSVRATCKGRAEGRVPAAISVGPGVAGAGTKAKVPVPIIILAVWQGFGVFSVLGYFIVQSTVVFGLVLHGLPAFSVLFSVAALSGYAAWAIYQRQAAGWFLALAIALFGLASTVATFAGRDMLQVFREMGLREEQIQIFYMFPQMRWIIWISIVPVTTAYLALLVYTWKFFSQAAPET